MRSLIAFAKKEMIEQVRTGKLLILTVIFIMFGVMNPAVAKLTPWLMELMAESLEQNGMIITAVEITALDSWVQFFKNMPMALLAFVLIESSILTKEYQTGTLILTLAKGFERYKVVAVKSTVLLFIWSALYWGGFTVTYLYNAFYWDNSVAQNIGTSVFCLWLFGVLILFLNIMFSTVFSSNASVLLSTGGIVAVSFFVSMIPRAGKLLPTKLLDGNSLIYGTVAFSEYIPAAIIATVVLILSFVVSVFVFNKKQI